MGSDTPISSETAKVLKLVSRQQWRHFWIQGGAFAGRSRRSPGVYSLPSLTVEAVDLFRIEATSIQLASGCEAFAIDLAIEREIGTPQSERLWRPRRERIGGFPSDLDLSPFLNTIIDVSLLRGTLSKQATDAANCHLFFDALRVHADDHRLLILPDEEMPESILLVRNGGLIDRVLSSTVSIVGVD